MKIILKKIGDILVPINEQEQEKLDKFSDAEYSVDMKNLDSRTAAQNRSLHLWCTQIAKLLNGRGVQTVGVFGNKIPWTMSTVKAQIVKGTLKKFYDIDSTTQMKRKEVDGMVDYVTDAFAEIKVEIPHFPSKALWGGKNDNTTKA